VKLCFPLMSRTLVYFHIYIILDFPITHKHAAVLCQLRCTCEHKTINMVVFFVKSNENTYPKGRALMPMYRVVPETKRGSWLQDLQYKIDPKINKTLLDVNVVFT